MAAQTLHLYVQGELVMIQHTFFQRFGHHGMCVLPNDVLSNDPLTDPETGAGLPSLREQVSLSNGIHHRLFCYARVLRPCGDGLYWADVAATPDLANTFHVILTEEDLYFALPYDVRVQGKSSAQILKMMGAHAREVRPAQRVAPVVAPECAPAPVLPLEPLAMVEVSTEELQEAIGPVTKDTPRDTNQQRVCQLIGSVCLQQALLQVMIDALMMQLYWSQWTHDSARISTVRAQCALVSSIQRWQRQSRQRCVNAVPVWSQEQHVVVWHLTVGDPFTARMAA
jgi:hypothetical protein